MRRNKTKKALQDRAWYERNKERKSEYDKRYRERNKERLKANRIRWLSENKEFKSFLDWKYRKKNDAKVKQAKAAQYKAKKDTFRAIDLRRNYGLSVDEYDQMHAAQGGLCAVCQKPPSNGKRLGVDHNHTTGAVRALLCHACNLLLGNARESVAVLEAAVSYLKRYS